LSFKEAAEELYVTPAAISQQIKFLEDVLGVQLFHRKNRQISLTKDGERGLAKVIEGFDALSEAVNLIKQGGSDTSLTVWSSPSFAGKWLVPRLNAFTTANPGIDLEISADISLIDTKGASEIGAEKFRRGDVDVAIRFGQGVYDGCRVDKLFEVSAIPLCSPELLKGEHALKSPEDLRFHTLLHDATPYEGRPSWSVWLNAAGVEDIEFDHGISFNSVSLALAAAVDGQGVVFTLKALAEDDIAAGRLVAPFDLSLPMNFAYYLITLEELADTPKVKAFRDWIIGAAESLAA